MPDSKKKSYVLIKKGHKEAEFEDLDKKMQKYKISIIEEEEILRNLQVRCESAYDKVIQKKSTAHDAQGKYLAINSRLHELERQKV